MQRADSLLADAHQHIEAFLSQFETSAQEIPQQMGASSLASSCQKPLLANAHHLGKPKSAKPQSHSDPQHNACLYPDANSLPSRNVSRNLKFGTNPHPTPSPAPSSCPNPTQIPPRSPNRASDSSPIRRDAPPKPTEPLRVRDLAASLSRLQATVERVLVRLGGHEAEQAAQGHAVAVLGQELQAFADFVADKKAEMQALVADGKAQAARVSGLEQDLARLRTVVVDSVPTVSGLGNKVCMRRLLNFRMV